MKRLKNRDETLINPKNNSYEFDVEDISVDGTLSFCQKYPVVAQRHQVYVVSIQHNVVPEKGVTTQWSLYLGTNMEAGQWGLSPAGATHLRERES